MFENDDPKLLVFAMERHRPVLGDAHVPGKLMSAMVIRQNQYGYDVRKDEIIDLGVVGEATLEVDADWLVSQHFDGVLFMIEKSDEGSFTIEESTYGERGEVADLEAAEAFARQFVETLALDDVFVGLCNEVSVPPEEISRVEEEFFDALERRCVEAARKAWEDREFGEDFVDD